MLFLLAGAAADAGEVVIARLPVDPATCYRLVFQADAGDQQARWVIRSFDQRGDVPHAGCYEAEWQNLVSGQSTYTRAFRTPPDAQAVEFSIRYSGELPQVSDVRLDPIVPDGLLVNGDFGEGQGNYSGWSEHNNTVIEQVDGKTAMIVQHNGFAITDRLPVDGGSLYRFERGSTMPSYVLAYDDDMHLLPPNRYNRHAEFRTPETARYLRLLYQTSFDHIPAYRTKTITSVALRRVDEDGVDEDGVDEGASASVAAPTDSPVFPGEIILSGGCDARQRYAAQELQHWIRQITGKRIPLLAKPSDRANTKILLGAEWATPYADDLKFLADSDGYAVRRDGDNIHVFGSHPRGTLFGVYALLEKNTDIIWPRPHPDFVAIFSKQANIDFRDTDFRSRPAFEIREMNFAGGDPNPVLSHQWIGRNGGNSPIKLGKGFPWLQWRSGATIGAGGGYIWSFMGLEQEDETLYPLVNGNRLRNKWRQPCYTHPSVPRIMADAAREMIDSVPGMPLEFLISRIGDNWEVCNCDECMKPIELADGTELAATSTNSVKDQLFFSTRNYMMLNKMAANLVEDNPTLKLHTHAYIFASEPPKVQLHPAIVPHFAAYPTKDERYPIMEQKSERGSVWKRRMQQWGEQQEVRFGYFGYYYASGFNALADTAGPDYRALAEMGGIHAHNEGFPADGSGDLNSWDVDGVEKWIIAKLQWDPTLDPADLREQYITRTYRDAAPQMIQFYQLISDSWHDASNPTPVNCHTASTELFQKFIVDPGIEKDARRLLLDAKNVATDRRSIKLIERTLAKFDMLAAELNRLPVPLVAESTQQWNQYESPHWYKAHQVSDFKPVANWRPVPQDHSPLHKTTVAMMRDQDSLYFKMDAFDDAAKATAPPSQTDVFPADDRVEIVLRSGSDTYYFALGADGGTYSLKNWDTNRDWSNKTRVRYVAGNGRWSALLAVPLADIGVDSESVDLDGKFCRVFSPHTPQREESTLNGRSIFHDHTLLRSPMNLDQ
ncbi:DUF4838 domain-containing protein [Rubripirellula lacrimiformis]|uniref:DUF4838 domain-containing protein n=1 Tax=Rubripirellula lacrimiformis TaxID=1930273 RepID=UPI001C54E809|nr:DUF4838 domain-containing protein [Rubripirellula lacrimiformis]